MNIEGNKIKSSLYSLHHAQVCYEWRDPVSAAGQYNSNKMLQLWRPVGDTVPDFTGPESEP